MPVDARPTIAAPDDDPYLWLEEIDGERAVAWVDAAERRRRSPSSARRDSPRIATRSRPSSTGRTTFPSSRGAGRISTTSGRTPGTRAASGAEPRSTASAPRSRTGRSSSTSMRSRRPRKRIGSGTAPRPCRARTIGDPVAVTRRQRRRRAARVRHRRQGVRERRLLSARGQGRHRLARPGHPPVVQRLRQGHGHQVRLPANGAAVAARVGRRSGAGADRDDAREHGPVGVGRSHARTRRRSGSPTSRASSIPSSGSATAAGPRSSSTCRPTSSIESHGDWLVVKRRTEWTIGGKTYAPDTLLGISLSAFLAGARDFTVLFEPGERRALQHFFWSDGQLIAVDPRRAEARVRGR